MRVRFTAASVAIALAVWAGDSSAQTATPSNAVTLIPTFPISGVQGKQIKGDELLVDRAIPAGVPFTVQLPVDEPGQVVATFEVWPLEDAKVCGQPNMGSPQYQKLGMSPGNKINDQNYVVANVSKLQIDTVYCYRVTGTTLLAKPVLREIATTAAQEMVKALEKRVAEVAPTESPGTICSDMITYSVFKKELRSSLDKKNFDADEESAAKLASAYWIGGNKGDKAGDKDGVDGPRTCVDYVDSLRGTETTDIVDSEVKAIRDALGKPAHREIRDPGPPRIPFSAGAELIPVDSESCLDEANIDTCIGHLVAQSGKQKYPANRDWIEKWITALRTVKLAKPELRVEELKKARPLPAVADGARPYFELYRKAQKEFWAFPDYIDQLTKGQTPIIEIDDAVAQLTAYEVRTKINVTATKQLLVGLNSKLKLQTKAKGEHADKLVKRAAKKDTLTSAIAGAMMGPEEDDKAANKGVRSFLRVKFGFRPGQGQGGHYETPTPKNYASVDVGVLAAAPFRGGVDPWIIPYVGLNLYFGSVDRDIPFDAMVGNSWQRLRQRISLTLGTTLTKPSVANRRTEGVFLGSYPLVSLGFRTTHYTRMGIGALFYRLGDVNPASTDLTLRAAPFISFSLDLDIYSAYTKTFPGPGGSFGGTSAGGSN